MSALWTAKNAQVATGGSGPLEWLALGVSIDSRQVVHGDLFVALIGPNHDGHSHVAAALAAGATAVMISRTVSRLPEDAPLLLVPDTEDGLRALARASRKRFAGKIIALTGSVGKTGSKEMLRMALEAQAPTSATRGNLNNHFGAPLTLARLPEAARYGVLELGMNHPGEISPLSRMCKPHCALITRIAPAHTEYFGSLDEVAAAKAEIFDGLVPSGTAIVNADDGYTAFLSKAAKDVGAGQILSFGASETANARLLSADLRPDGSHVEADILGQRVSYEIGAPGKHWVINSLGVLTAVVAVGADVQAAAQVLSKIKAPPGRGATERLVLPQGPITLIDESYNASPAAMRAAFAVLASHTPEGEGRRVAILGDMLELGSGSAAAHGALGARLAGMNIQAVYTAGSEIKELVARLDAQQRATHAPNTALLAKKIVQKLQPGDVVLVKGSLGIDMAKIIEALRAAAAEAAGTDPGGSNAL
ncbi:MAG: UDP-N-acetylmuramoyl-tripeptide--D-alanyl-D-alanine ligase [Alphaproteobacteria bacterium]